MNDVAKRWQRIIIHADMDAFYAAVEQLDDPRLRGRPILVGSDSRRAVVLTASYEARPTGVGSAMPMQRARRLCPDAVVVPPRFERYQEVSRQIMATLSEFSPVVEPLSLDEAFLDMTGGHLLFGTPDEMGVRIKAAIRRATGGLTASVGVSATRYVAKVASGFAKPDGLTIVPPAEARDWLAPLPVSHLWGAGAKTAARLREHGLETIGQVAVADPQFMTHAFGSLGKRFVALANAVDPREIVGSLRSRSIGVERTLNVDVSSRVDIEAQLRRSAAAVAERLRRRAIQARGVRIKLKRTDFRLISRQAVLPAATDVGAVLFARAKELLGEIQDCGPFRLVGLAAYDLDADVVTGAQLDLVPAPSSRARRLETTLDALVHRFGRRVVQPAGELDADRGAGSAANLDFLSDEEEKR